MIKQLQSLRFNAGKTSKVRARGAIIEFFQPLGGQASEGGCAFREHRLQRRIMCRKSGKAGEGHTLFRPWAFALDPLAGEIDGVLNRANHFFHRVVAHSR